VTGISALTSACSENVNQGRAGARHGCAHLLRHLWPDADEATRVAVGGVIEARMTAADDLRTDGLPCVRHRRSVRFAGLHVVVERELRPGPKRRLAVLVVTDNRRSAGWFCWSPKAARRSGAYHCVPCQPASSRRRVVAAASRVGPVPASAAASTATHPELQQRLRGLTNRGRLHVTVHGRGHLLVQRHD
jgi:hypothetical protein